ncbi:uncharacterized protein EI90DRAFT_3052737 [Cantharellus anzutake]|uniref:uncharacterized protein n=1 Tax=Cantharellus anzutake TaxID=1750568 RepID=UPI0019035B5B|nr:uncharacterized protein EI90DRAFT_3092701 [Cantharellus anzutake]XP_038917183.1 uncharacterized protein EI90DRAFT_3052737 [Cantharellus anzutake]KAF8312900.1 hypothetical protein EI90DRAFT_3092701 [Cantharellus anzutake]KAF8333030.1 hypothetical protein EI90DRAFT_3052737 [Cantharellus anzutake]
MSHRTASERTFDLMSITKDVSSSEKKSSNRFVMLKHKTASPNRSSRLFLFSAQPKETTSRDRTCRCLPGDIPS